MDDLTLERYMSDPKLRAELEAAARRERARMLKRFAERNAATLRMGAPRGSTHVQGRPA